MTQRTSGNIPTPSRIGAAVVVGLTLILAACSGGGGDDEGADSTGGGATAPADGSQTVTGEDAGGAAATTVVVVPDSYTAVSPAVSVTAEPVKGGGLEPATEKQQQGARQVADAVGSAGNLSDVWVLSGGGDPLATVSRFQVDATSAASPRFRDQFAVQMLTAAQAVAEPRFVAVDGTTVAVSEGPTSAAAWFAGDTAVLLVANGDDAAGRIESLVRTAIPLVADA